MEQAEFLTDDFLIRLQIAISTIQTRIRWKPSKDVKHLQTRIGYGHLPPSATLADYEKIIHDLLHDPLAEVYVYVWQAQTFYPTIVGAYYDQKWLVMFGMNSVMETAFPPTDPDEYLADPRFRYLGRLQEVMQ